MQKELYDVVVVGAGIVGCSVSYHLAKSHTKRRPPNRSENHNMLRHPHEAM